MALFDDHLLMNGPLSGAGGNAWVRHLDTGKSDSLAWRIQRFRPRIDRLVAHVERWIRQGDRGVHWCSISRADIITLYGNIAKNCIADPLGLDTNESAFMESLPPLEFEYRRADIDDTVMEIETANRECLLHGLQRFQQAPAF